MPVILKRSVERCKEKDEKETLETGHFLVNSELNTPLFKHKLSHIIYQ